MRALTHALDGGRLHHAYLFTGTRGVGKTTLSRIFAKALNCETGVTSTPCGVCRACREIDEGRFVDYVEMDAASNRGVDEMAALLERAVYAPVDARFKVYMIDEVHMLTNHAFNAMLKTLEEPPPHVKFILATTDPQKIPVTVLSRCLQFNLKQMPAGNIVEHLTHILGEEKVEFEPQALRLLARAADGSMRDALSLTDQAIAYSANQVTEEAVRGMLGALDQSYLIRLIDALLAGDGANVLAIADEMALRSLSFSTALQDLASLFHRIGWAQFAPSSVLDEWPEADDIRRFAEAVSPEQVQLFYQIATLGRSELGLAPDEYAGFTMTLLRMLAFEPSVSAGGIGSAPASKPAAAGAGARTASPVAASARSAAPAVAPPAASRPAAPVPQSTEAAPPNVPVAGPQASAPAPLAKPATEAYVVPPWEDEGESAPNPGTAPQAAPVAPVEPAAAAPAPAEETQAVQSPAAAAAPQFESREEPAAAASARGGASAALDVLRSKGMRVATGRGPVAAAGTAATAPAPKAAPRVEVKVPTPDPARRAAAAQEAQARPAPRNANAQQDASGAPPWDDIPPDDYVPLGADDAYFAPPDDGFVPAYDNEPSAPRTAASVPTPSPAVVDVSKLPPGIALDPIGFTGDWPALAATLTLKGISYQLAFNSELTALEGTLLKLSVPVPQYAEASQVAKLKTALAERLGKTVEVSVEVGPARRTAAALDAADRAQRQREAEREIGADPFVQQLIRDFGASIVPGSIRPVAPQAASGGSQAAH
ncbi:DNA polymerase-3 subunit gamma/tau [Paraburkholderia silvatlantica]|uniref:DNA polymerase III subunit gamma/tau n=1 Tax=Paraburkholderia silvatlantica TaxID=321895 RepID=A0A2U1ADI1_9BURK|nr:DNA polymerase-3 subunit gamma/tau [Paraburkholderia silvatlantica]PXW38697.1 DNA polymerase-3 subunit gamma/tau [Paraburkholderia silvatlantica]PYE22576.1 DNA polymerase-3 subunit gamma/tau [Paraburkholderia silvatlantica]TDQ89570.1 DNA polymerase-3 subunit gamma/tau [Paraburkholderia silvatlantica]